MTENFQLSEQQIVAFVPTRDPFRAKSFYQDRLGLRLASEELPFALVFDAHGVALRVTVVKDYRTAEHTILGWCVADISLAVKTLQDAGVTFARYPGMQQDELGIWRSPGGAKVAWFKDPDGNTLSLSEL
jgi:catechol 2,3-dioxygenase-like lactoylglutathione lyase family enzyme